MHLLSRGYPTQPSIAKFKISYLPNNYLNNDILWGDILSCWELHANILFNYVSHRKLVVTRHQVIIWWQTVQCQVDTKAEHSGEASGVRWAGKWSQGVPGGSRRGTKETSDGGSCVGGHGEGSLVNVFLFFPPNPPIAIGEWSWAVSMRRYHPCHVCVILSFPRGWMKISPLLIFFKNHNRQFYWFWRNKMQRTHVYN